MVYVYLKHPKSHKYGTITTKRISFIVQIFNNNTIKTTMKRIKIVSFLLLIALFESNCTWAQEKKNRIVFGSMVTRFNNIEILNFYKTISYGYYEHPAGPGIEAIYYRCLTPNTCVGTGISWQHGRVASDISAVSRFRFDEIGVPMVFQTGFNFCRNYRFFFTTGLVFGDIVHTTAETPDKYEYWHTFPISYSTDDTFFIDYYLDAGFCRTIFKQNEISIAPFLKSRINTTWLNLHEKRFMYGIKLTYSIKF